MSEFSLPEDFWESVAYIRKIQEKYPEEETEQPKYPHYFKDVSNVNKIDIYKVLDLWQVTHPCLQHAAKKILVAGNRGYKNVEKDIQEAIDSLERWKEMQVENSVFNDKQEENNNV